MSRTSRLRALLLRPSSIEGAVARVYSDRIEIATRDGMRSLPRVGGTAYAVGDRVRITGDSVSRLGSGVVVRV